MVHITKIFGIFLKFKIKERILQIKSILNINAKVAVPRFLI